MSELEPRQRVTVTRRMLLAAASAGLLLISAGCWLAYFTKGTWAEAAGWVEALATVAAFGAAIVAALLVGRTLELELVREDQRLKADRSGQAALVAAWPTDLVMLREELPTPLGTIQQYGAVGPNACRVEVRNASQVPVTDVVALVTIEVRDRVQGNASPWSTSSVITARRTAAYLPPSDAPDTWIVLSPEFIRIPDLDNRPLSPSEWKARIDFYFMDAAGIRWHRSRTGLHARESDCERLGCSDDTPIANLNAG